MSSGTAPVIYLDHNATTPVAPTVIAAMTRALETAWANPASLHAPGVVARDATEEARGQVATLLGCATDEVVFTSGGTEANNVALLGVARHRGEHRRRVVISAVEHPAVDEVCKVLAGEGFHIVRVGVGPDGRVDAETFSAELTADTAVASLMLANNETGALQPVASIAKVARHLGVPFHTDAAQAAGKLPVRVDDLGVDLLSVAGHKLYGPKGIGALYVREGTSVSPVLFGAPQERGLRPGTENTPGIVGLGAACALAEEEMATRVEHCRQLTARLLQNLRSRLGDVPVNGPENPDLRLPNTLNVSLAGAPSQDLLPLVPEVATAAGAACHAGRAAPSAALLAMGLPTERAVCALRLSVGRGNTEAEIDRAAEMISAAALRLRSTTHE